MSLENHETVKHSHAHEAGVLAMLKRAGRVMNVAEFAGSQHGPVGRSRWNRLRYSAGVVHPSRTNDLESRDYGTPKT